MCVGCTSFLLSHIHVACVESPITCPCIKHWSTYTILGLVSKLDTKLEWGKCNDSNSLYCFGLLKSLCLDTLHGAGKRMQSARALSDIHWYLHSQQFVFSFPFSKPVETFTSFERWEKKLNFALLKPQIFWLNKRAYETLFWKLNPENSFVSLYILISFLWDDKNRSDFKMGKV